MKKTTKTIRVSDAEELLNTIYGISMGCQNDEEGLNDIQKAITAFEEEHGIGDFAEPRDHARYHHFDGVGTICVIPIDDGACAVGFAVQHPLDTMNRAKGRLISRGRAERQREGSLAAIRSPEQVESLIRDVRNDHYDGIEDFLLKDDIEDFLRGTHALISADQKQGE